MVIRTAPIHGLPAIPRSAQFGIAFTGLAKTRTAGTGLTMPVPRYHSFEGTA